MGKFSEYLKEERLKSSDKKSLMKVIGNSSAGKEFGKVNIVLSSFKKDFDKEERVINIEYKINNVTFTYNADHFELTNTLVDICDDLNYKFNTDTKKNTTAFEVITK